MMFMDNHHTAKSKSRTTFDLTPEGLRQWEPSYCCNDRISRSAHHDAEAGCDASIGKLLSISATKLTYLHAMIPNMPAASAASGVALAITEQEALENLVVPGSSV
jgi:hypothetical protein